MSNRRVASAVAETVGTVAALACLSVAAFTIGFAVGMAAAGLSLLLIDFKVATTISRQKGGTQ